MSFGFALILVYEALRSLWLSAFVQWCEDNGIVNPLPDPVRTDLYNIVFKFQKGQIDSKSVSETSVLVMTSQMYVKGNHWSIRVFLSTVLSQTVSQDI
jgi:hypothetical protein